MVKYIIKRILLAIVILLGVSVIIYSLVRMMPVDFITTQFSDQFAQNNVDIQAEIERLKVFYGLNDGIIEGYFKWLGKMLQGDLGNSFKYSDKVSTIIVENMGISFGIAFAALILEFLIAIPLGVKAATKQYGVVDYTASVLAMIGTALPTFFFAAICIQLFSVQLDIFPVNGMTSTLPIDASGWTRFWDVIWHLILPVGIMVFLSVGSLMRYTRTNTLEVLNADYIRTARAKGLGESKVIYKHAFRNTLIPLVTIVGGSLPGLFAGALITETLYSIQGIGYTSYTAMTAGDIPFSMFYLLFMAVLTLAGNLISDILYAVVDPRVRIA